MHFQVISVWTVIIDCNIYQTSLTPKSIVIVKLGPQANHSLLRCSQLSDCVEEQGCNYHRRNVTVSLNCACQCQNA